MKKRIYFALGSCLMLQGVQQNPALGIATSFVHSEIVSVPLYHHEQARELLGVDEISSKEINYDRQMQLALFIHSRTNDLLPSSFREESGSVAQSLIMTANAHHMDPLLLMALISHESRFNPLALGRHGEIGLMQIKPSTVLWMIERKMVPQPKVVTYEAIQEELKNPALNIMYGTAYLSSLRSSFKKRGSLYLAAYNMGARNVKLLLKEGERPRIYSDRVLGQYVSLALDFSNVERANQRSLQVASMKVAANLDL